MENQIKSPLFLEGWLEFNRQMWGLQPLRVRYTLEDSACPAVETVYYLTKSGRIARPGLNTYLPVAFESTPAQHRHRLYRQWEAVAAPLVRDMRKRGVRGTVAFTPDVHNIRPWQWAGFRAGVDYTFLVEFPFDLHQVDKAIRRRMRGAQEAGYTCQRTTNMAHVMECLRGTQQRQGINHGGLGVKDFESLQALLGDEYVRAYICYASNGEPASTNIVLHYPGSTAIGWVAGTRTEHLSSSRPGATQLLLSYILEDLQAANATGFDFGGADSPGLSTAKMGWGGRLVPFYTVEAYTLRSLAKWGLGSLRYWRMGRS